jgi:hypothetical protein
MFWCPCCKRYIRVEFSFFTCLRAAGLTFTVARAIIETVPVLVETDAKDSGRWDVDVAGQVTSVRSASTRDPPVQVETTHIREASVLEIDVMWGHTRTVDRETIFSLLIGYLDDVSSYCIGGASFGYFTLAYNLRLFCDRLFL